MIRSGDREIGDVTSSARVAGAAASDRARLRAARLRRARDDGDVVGARRSRAAVRPGSRLRSRLSSARSRDFSRSLHRELESARRRPAETASVASSSRGTHRISCPSCGRRLARQLAAEEVQLDAPLRVRVRRRRGSRRRRATSTSSSSRSSRARHASSDLARVALAARETPRSPSRCAPCCRRVTRNAAVALDDRGGDDDRRSSVGRRTGTRGSSCAIGQTRHFGFRATQTIAPKSISAWLKSKTCAHRHERLRDASTDAASSRGSSDRPRRRRRGTARARRWCREWPRARRNAKLRIAPAV